MSRPESLLLRVATLIQTGQNLPALTVAEQVMALIEKEATK